MYTVIFFYKALGSEKVFESVLAHMSGEPHNIQQLSHFVNPDQTFIKNGTGLLHILVLFPLIYITYCYRYNF